MRQEYKAKGYVTFEAEVTDDEEDEEEDAAVGAAALCVIAQGGEKEYEAATPWIPQGRGRRRFRPGVVKQAGRVKKIIIQTI